MLPDPGGPLPDPVGVPLPVLGAIGQVGVFAKQARRAWIPEVKDLSATIAVRDLCGRVLAEHPFQDTPTLDDVCRLDAWARQEVGKWACV